MKNKLNRNGFTFLLALMIITIMGIMLGVVGQSWQTILQRDKEEELLFRGTQIRDGITRWKKTGGRPLRELKDLVLDPNSLTKIRYLRRLYTDPMTGKEWTLISDPNQGITGVASKSTLQPFKAVGFPEELKDFNDKKQYSDWKFVWKAPATPGARPGAGTTGATGTSPATTPTGVR